MMTGDDDDISSIYQISTSVFITTLKNINRGYGVRQRCTLNQ
jgi:hypothetical protein